MSTSPSPLSSTTHGRITGSAFGASTRTARCASSTSTANTVSDHRSDPVPPVADDIPSPAIATSATAAAHSTSSLRRGRGLPIGPEMGPIGPDDGLSRNALTPISMRARYE